jgi:lactoylglutathione lyase
MPNMHTEHKAVWSDDIEALASFYAQYLDTIVGNWHVHESKGFQSRFRTFLTSARLELMHSTRLDLSPEDGKATDGPGSCCDGRELRAGC